MNKITNRKKSLKYALNLTVKVKKSCRIHLNDLKKKIIITLFVDLTRLKTLASRYLKVHSRRLQVSNKMGKNKGLIRTKPDL